MTRVLAAAAAAALAAAAHAQQVRAVAPIGTIAPAAPRAGGDNLPVDDPGTPVEMLENPQLDRYLRAARKFLDAQNWTGAIQVLQDVVEGRTSEVIPGEPEPAPPAPPEPEKPAQRGSRPEVTSRTVNRPAREPAGEGRPPAQPKPVQLDARNSVFSNDGRLYRPVRRLCHELLARMPDVGIEIYRTTHEAAAAEMLQTAIAGGSTGALEEVANRYFVTLPGGRALALLGDRLMHEGRYRAAVQVLTDLLDVYPAQNRAQLGITAPWCRFKIAVCLGLAGEQEAAHAAAEAMAAAHRDESLRIAGELQAVADLPGSRLFASGASRPVSRPDVPATAVGSWLAADTDTVVAMWQYRFRTSDPYREPKSTRDSSRFSLAEGSGSLTMPFAGRYGPASWVAFADGASDEAPHAWFLEHYRLRRTDAASGLLLAQGDRAEEPPAPQENQGRVRVAANDYALLRPIDDGERLYAIFGAPRGNSTEAVKVSELVAHQRSDLSRVWSSAQWADGDSGFAGVTFLAAPTVFGERLLLPALRRGDFTLECVDRGTGRPLWHTLLHRGGTRFSRPPGCPVIVHGGTALVATNAGCVAAVDAFAGDLRWIRRCERVDPLRRRKGRRPVNDEDGWRGQFVQEELATFLPNDLHVVRDGVVVGACDSEMLSCLDVATGEVRWMIDATTRHAPWGTPPKLRSLVGVIGDDVFALADNHLVAIDGVGGLVRWVRELPATTTPQHVGRGRGTVVGDHVVVPGGRELIVWSRDGATTRRITLPVFDASREPLGGSFNVSSRGPWLAVGYQGGVEVFSSAPALRQLAATTTDPLRQCAYLVHAGELDAAIARAAAAVRSSAGNGGDAARREALGKQLLAMVRERAHRELQGADLHGALAMLDAIGDLLIDRGLRLDWHLARIELCKEAGDMRAHETEQMRLYDYMEGKGG